MIVTELKNALKEEFSAWYGYIVIRDWLSGPYSKDIVKFYEKTAKDELEDHAYWLMRRLREFDSNIQSISDSPKSWLTATHPYLPPVWSKKNNLIVETRQSLLTNVKNEKGAIQTYKKIIELTDGIDDVTCKKCKEILKDEEKHLEMLERFLAKI